MYERKDDPTERLKARMSSLSTTPGLVDSGVECTVGFLGRQCEVILVKDIKEVNK